MKVPKSVFLVEDSVHDQFFFMLALGNIDDAVLLDVARNGKEAIAKLDTSIVLPDIIFTDIHMPVMDGIECLVEILKNPQTKNIPVVILSTDTEQIEKARDIGARAFIKKTSDRDILQQRLEHVIQMDFDKDRYLADETFDTARSAY